MLHYLDYTPELAPHFDRINREWITKMFRLEAVDEAVIGNPQLNIIDEGGYIWFAKHPDLGIVGTCALMKKDEGVFELTKMGVVSEARGLKVGEGLLQHVLNSAHAIAFNTLFLLTNKKCEPAIHLYEKNGFVHCEKIMQKFGCAYERCDVAMHYKGAITN
ncbi:GNAT family N-acetyltransferase [Alteromonas stellipolaris]|uniref:GNAT family N-acetyltransferase n=1 Tax=Alteromonas stellipolaris TaxID=233316 RepID=UPI001E30635D|nr:GNAT family N-acetyltransferase [Alteromonas stellipolaris]